MLSMLFILWILMLLMLVMVSMPKFLVSCVSQLTVSVRIWERRQAILIYQCAFNLTLQVSMCHSLPHHRCCIVHPLSTSMIHPHATYR